MTGSDAQAKKVESWSEAQGNRSTLYPHKTVCACQSVQERKLVQQFTTPWQVNKIHFGVDRNPQQPQQAPQQQQQPQQQQSAEVRPAQDSCLSLERFSLWRVRVRCACGARAMCVCGGACWGAGGLGRGQVLQEDRRFGGKGCGHAHHCRQGTRRRHPHTAARS